MSTLPYLYPESVIKQFWDKVVDGYYQHKKEKTPNLSFISPASIWKTSISDNSLKVNPISSFSLNLIIFCIHIFLQSDTQRSLYTLKESWSAPIFFYLNITKIAITSPSVCPFTVPPPGLSGVSFLYKFFIEDKYAQELPGPPRNLWGEKKDGI